MGSLAKVSRASSAFRESGLEHAGAFEDFELRGEVGGAGLGLAAAQDLFETRGEAEQAGVEVFALCVRGDDLPLALEGLGDCREVGVVDGGLFGQAAHRDIRDGGAGRKAVLGCRSSLTRSGS